MEAYDEYGYCSSTAVQPTHSGPEIRSPEAVVKWMGAIQAQDYQQSLWAIGLRTKSAGVADIEQAIVERKILRTWPMRGTIHFVPAEDAKWMLRLSASRMIAAGRRRLEQLELDDAIMERCKELFYYALQGCKQLSRPDMMKLLEDAGISTKNQRGYHMLWHTSQTGLICQGPMQDKQQTFVLLDEWVPHSIGLSREESLAELAGRYYASRGPATIHDFAWWAGLTVADARQGLEMVKPRLVSHKLDGKEYWMTRDDPTAIRNDKSIVHLLPGFDEYLLGYKDRDAVLAAQDAPKIVPGNNGIFLPTLVVDGRIVGTWNRKLKKKSIDLTLIPFIPLDESEGKIIKAAKRYSDFIGLPISQM